MGRWGTYPQTIDAMRDLDIRFLTKYNYLKPQQFKTGSVTWTHRNGTRNSISIAVVTYETDGIITISYTLNGKENVINRIELITRPSNLGKGLLWFFVCPRTGTVCRKLHSINGYFMHRSAKPNLMYSKQIENKHFRFLGKYSILFNDEPEQLLPYRKYYKTHYKGKPTKRYLKYLKYCEKQDNLDLQEFKNLMNQRFKGNYF